MKRPRGKNTASKECGKQKPCETIIIIIDINVDITTTTTTTTNDTTNNNGSNNDNNNSDNDNEDNGNDICNLLELLSATKASTAPTQLREPTKPSLIIFRSQTSRDQASLIIFRCMTHFVSKEFFG